MRQKTYRVLLAIFAGLILVNLPTVLSPVLSHKVEIKALWGIQIICFALLPVSIIGLWRDHVWGFVLALLTTLVIIVPHGLMHALEFGSCHLVVLTLATIRFLTLRKECNKIAQPSVACDAETRAHEPLQNRN